MEKLFKGLVMTGYELVVDITAKVIYSRYYKHFTNF